MAIKNKGKKGSGLRPPWQEGNFKKPVAPELSLMLLLPREMQIKQKAKASVARSKKGAGRAKEGEGGREVGRGGTHSTHLYAVSFGFVFSFLSTAAHNAVNELRGQRSQGRRLSTEPVVNCTSKSGPKGTQW